MSDPPPTRKIGSLRDRIAAFENKGPAPTPSPPAPRPKPGGASSWKPRPASPPPAAEESTEKKVAGGMSAADAKESIQKGGSLKERMAALQGLNASPAAPPPRASGDKPKWKPPPPVLSPPEEKTEEQVAAPKEHPTAPPAVEVEAKPDDAGEAPPAEQAAEEPKEQDEEDEERQRRAAIAARMARLGGARIGLAPPVFAKKPDVKKPTSLPKPEETKEEAKEAEEETSAPTVQSPPAKEAVSPPVKDSSEEYFAPPGEPDASATSLLSPEPTSNPASAPRSPAAMPVPAVPRRAAPPRKKTPKSPANPAPILEAPTTESPTAGTPQETSDETSKQLQEIVHKSKEDEVSLGLPPAQIGSGDSHHLENLVVPESEQHDEPSAADAPVDEAARAEEVSEQPYEESEGQVHDEVATPEESHAVETPIVKESGPDAEMQEVVMPKEEVVESTPEEEAVEAKEEAVEPKEEAVEPKEEAAVETEEETAEPEEEEDDAARRKRIAERLRQQGGFNPFAAPSPIRKPSSPSLATVSRSPDEPEQETKEPVEEALVSPPPQPRRQSTRQSSVGSEFPPSEHAGVDTGVEKSATSEPNDNESSTPVPESAEHKTDEEEEEEDDSHNFVPGVAHTITENIAEEPENDVEGFQASDDGNDAALEHQESEPDEAVPYDEPEEQQVDSEDGATPLGLVAQAVDQAKSETMLPPPLKRVSLPPPRREIPQQPRSSSPPAEPSSQRSVSPVALSPAEDVGRPLVSPHEEHVDSSPVATHPDDPEEQEEDFEDAQAAPIPPVEQRRLPSRASSMEVRSPTRSLPPPPPPPTLPEVDADNDAGELEPLHEDVAVSNISETQEYAEDSHVAVPKIAVITQGEGIAPPRERQESSSSSDLEREILDDSHGDPIDPAFYSPNRTSSSITFPPVQPPETPVTPETTNTAAPANEEDEGQARRRTIAERMAKLGGIRLGAPPPVNRRPPPPPEPERADEEQEQGKEEEATEEAVEEPADAASEEPEEDEAARRRRIAARIAGMGGMRFGMAPIPKAPAPPAGQHDSDEDVAPPPPPPRAASLRSPPVRQSPVDSDADSGSQSDVVQVEAEESELEEVTHDDVEDEAPPPLPSRATRRTSFPQPTRSPSIPQTRPPVPTARPPVPQPPPRPPLPTAPSHGDFVLVDEADASEEQPPLPPPRTASLKKGPPKRNVPPPPPPPGADLGGSSSTQWESTLDFGGETDLSLSGQWSEDSTQYPPPTTKDATEPPATPAAPSVTLGSDELMAQWGRVGVQIHEIATTLHEKSRKALVGDRSYVGFITAVLNQVPNAAQPAPPYESFGYLIYEQAGPSVIRHTTDIMPGDIIVLQDAKLKGHKGLQSYNQTVGAGEAVCAIVGDFEIKKSKVKAFQANQHVGHESVESVSYRLEDLKSGVVKIFRVLEA
ncbi:hypothetical protein BC835DRAFT_1421378 [Cytidiella melzeri]|nr:hypothetical protein BC835DRAFT_1421378 [Cytidiella melzeri]